MMPNDRTAPADSSQVIADLQRERDEALARETAIAEVLGVINSSVGDLTPVFQVILEKAHSLCGATFGGLLTYDGNRFQAVALHGVPEAFAKIARQPFPPTPSNPVSRFRAADEARKAAASAVREMASLAASLPRVYCRGYSPAFPLLLGALSE